MTPETLHDAITLLPEELLIPVDRLRQKKHIPWKSVAGLAACLCLIAGLWFWNPGNQLATDSATGNAAPEHTPMEHTGNSIADGSEHSTANTGVLVTVIATGEDYLLVTYPQPDIFNGTTDSEPSAVRLTFENLAQAPQLQANQTIRIYFEPEQFDEKEMIIRPYQIQIIEEDTQ